MQYTHIYINTLVKNLFKTKNKLTLPKLTKITLNWSTGNICNNKNQLKITQEQINRITLQKPAPIKTKKSIANFNLKKGTINALKTTLRNKHMYTFLNKLINIAIPRIKNFKGFKNKAIDHAGNFNYGIKECSIFPEIFLNPTVGLQLGLNITITLKNSNRKKSQQLFKAIGFPFI